MLIEDSNARMFARMLTAEVYNMSVCLDNENENNFNTVVQKYNVHCSLKRNET